MVKVVVGDLFKSNAQTLVNTVNCVGIMGKGVALEFKKRFPDMYEDYARRCSLGQVKLGFPYLYRRSEPPWILNFPTKDHWRSVSRLDDIVAGLDHLARHYREWEITSLAVPPLGCGQGQLEWRVVGPTLYRHLKRLTIPVEIYAPFGTPSEELQLTFLDPTPNGDQSKQSTEPPSRIDPSWVALVEILSRIEKEPYHWPVGRTTFQKIAYFATRSNIPTRLNYERGSYGPYAPELKEVITRLANNSVIREERFGQMFRVRVGPTFPDARRAFHSDLDRWSTVIDKVADLFVRMDTRRAEVTATVHFAANELHEERSEPPTEMDVFTRVMDWKQRRRPPLDEGEVALAVRQLGVLGWLNVRGSSELPVDEQELLEV